MQEINKLLGGPFLAPWQLDELPDDWLDAFLGMIYNLPALRGGLQENDAIMQQHAARMYRAK